DEASLSAPASALCVVAGMVAGDVVGFVAGGGAGLSGVAGGAGVGACATDVGVAKKISNTARLAMTIPGLNTVIGFLGAKGTDGDKTTLSFDATEYCWI
ncbi:MAG TPA: hypothetical protein VFC46_05010, partial [Humisphaera sp.]|nr:hypothetical protein [Humisphaera sp.]